jgi:CDGSH-type Zn-finger protein
VKLVIKCRARGPFTVSGDLGGCELYDAEGARLDLAGRTTVSLCRCGASKSKPLCDGSHNRVGFEAPPPEPTDDAFDLEGWGAAPAAAPLAK